ncbi:helix-turn-helix transcriptional regulator [Rubellicoccus peritrichatus]|uniref:Helix-turn-helix transcriptional regulator n=1 Tax=Rubellicoccus peritrichatus TaxID=3080537 RepID=A0AAQ3L974_9BACT|nr:helix-turn-helix transcriptional regulator [Puniceicoccus sp. CR14]WOO41156.1 helix-turn-helix transcriptional regulator [Puniceicoccus sp. CR14]
MNIDNYAAAQHPSENLFNTKKNFSLEIISCGSHHLGETWKTPIQQVAFWRYIISSENGCGFYSGSKKIEIQADQIYMIPPFSDIITWQETNPHFFYIHFNAPKSFERSRNQYHILPLDTESKERVERLRQSIPSGLTNKPSTLIQAVLLCSTALIEISQDDLVSAEEDSAIDDIMDKIRNLYIKEYRTEDIAARIGMCPDAFIRRFKAYAGMTPYQYFLSARISTAAYLLGNTDKTIEEISEFVGFKDRFQFSQSFKNRTEYTPGKYRRMVRMPNK